MGAESSNILIPALFKEADLVLWAFQPQECLCPVVVLKECDLVDGKL